MKRRRPAKSGIRKIEKGVVRTPIRVWCNCIELVCAVRLCIHNHKVFTFFLLECKFRWPTSLTISFALVWLARSLSLYSYSSLALLFFSVCVCACACRRCGAAHGFVLPSIIQHGTLTQSQQHQPSIELHMSNRKFRWSSGGGSQQQYWYWWC